MSASPASATPSRCSTSRPPSRSAGTPPPGPWRPPASPSPPAPGAPPGGGAPVARQPRPAAGPVGGYSDPRPMVYSGLYPIDGSEYPLLREALDKLLLNDAALTYEPETSAALGFGFRVGFLGLLHLEIVRERLEREAGISLISTAPNVVYRVVMEDRSEVTVTNPSDWPEGKIDKVYEPIVNATVIAPRHNPAAVLGRGH